MRQVICIFILISSLHTSTQLAKFVFQHLIYFTLVDIVQSCWLLFYMKLDLIIAGNTPFNYIYYLYYFPNLM